jgi:hypothetical protein
MKKLSILFVFAALSLSTVSFAGDKDKEKSCAKDKKSCCKVYLRGRTGFTSHSRWSSRH